MLLRVMRIDHLPRGCFNVETEKQKGKGNDMIRDRIQHSLDTIYEKVFNQGQADLYPGLVSGPYLQHNPLFPNGLAAITGYIKQAGRIPCEVKRVAIDGDLAFVHVRYLDWGGQETAGVDIFRFDQDGKVVEHWDVLQPVPASSNNANTMF
jgi:predicted SnoaL-like aldol condensation-catalyzing enzyme